MAPLGLVISELITNALKYGKGSIDVIVKHAGDHAQLTVRDEATAFLIITLSRQERGLECDWSKAIPVTAARQ